MSVVCGTVAYRGQMAALWAETTLWGVYIPIYVSGLYILASQRRDIKFSLVCTANFLLSTAHWLSILVSTVMTPNYSCNTECFGSICSTCGTETTRTIRESNIYNLLLIVSNLLFTVNQIIADGVIIWRCYIVWGSRISVVILPVICLIGTTVCGLYMSYAWSILYAIRRAAPPTETEPPLRFMKYNNIGDIDQLVSLIFSMATTVITTALILGRIIYVTYDLAKNRKRRKRIYNSIISSLIESGALIAIAYIITIGTKGHSFPGEDVALSIVAQCIGIGPTLVIIQLGLPNRYDVTDVGISSELEGVPTTTKETSAGITGQDTIAMSDGTPSPGAKDSLNDHRRWTSGSSQKSLSLLQS